MKATNYGTCQICESTQKTDARTNRVAKHGYTLAWGWQSGACLGSGHLPLEVSKAYAEAQLENCKAAVAAFKPTECPERTVASRWEACPAVTAWKVEQRAQAGRKQYITWTTARLANWAPKAQAAVDEVESVKSAAKATRAGIRALSGAVALAKRDLVNFGEKFSDAADQAINGALYAERNAFWTACAANNDCASVWPKSHLLVSIPYFATNRVAKLVELAQASNNADLIEGAAKLGSLSAAYEAARAAYEAAKA